MAENTFTYNFNELILAKQQLKSIIQDGGLEPGEVFAQYPGYIASIIEGGGTSSYLLVTKEELYACGYITAYDVSNMSYATQSYVADYVSTHSGGGSGDLSDYVTYTYLESKEYITAADVPDVDLDDYPTYTYLYTYVGDALNEYAPDLTYYPTFDDISDMGYITAADVPEVNLSYVLSTYNLRYINETPFGDGKQLYLNNSGLSVADTGAIFPNTYSYSQIVNYLSNDSSRLWIGGPTMKNYVEGRIAELESSSVTPSYLADNYVSYGYASANYVSYGYATANYVSYGYAYNTFVSYSYLGDLEEITEYILGSGSSSAPENIYATKTELGAYVSKIELSNLSYATEQYVDDEISNIDLPIINENLIPKENATYTLGSPDAIYRYAYIQTLRGISTGFSLVLGTDPKYDFYSSAFRPRTNGNINLGGDQYKWAATYTANLYTNTAYLQDTSYTKSIVPAENNSYTLGDADHFYYNNYTSRTQYNNNSKIYNDNGGIRVSVNNYNGFRFGTTSFVPYGNNYTLGDSTHYWGPAYISNLYADTIHNFIWTGTSAEYAALDNYTTYQIYLIQEA